jgi:hypothetical protein
MNEPYGLKIVDHQEQCPYLGDRQATMPFYLPLYQLTPEALDAALADYRAGEGPFITVIDAERQQLRTEDDLARARADYLRRFAELIATRSPVRSRAASLRAMPATSGSRSRRRGIIPGGRCRTTG